MKREAGRDGEYFRNAPRGDVFVVAMPDKVEGVTQRLGELGLLHRARVRKAVDARQADLDALEREGKIAPEYRAEVEKKPAAYGCLASHKANIEAFLKSSAGSKRTPAKAALFLEDDLVFPRGEKTARREVRAFMKKFASLGDEEPLVGYAGYCYAQERGNAVVDARGEPVPGLFELRGPRCTHAFALNRKGAEAVREALARPMHTPIDELFTAMGAEGKLRLVGADTPLVVQDWEAKPEEGGRFPGYDPKKAEAGALNARADENSDVLQGETGLIVGGAVLALGLFLALLGMIALPRSHREVRRPRQIERESGVGVIAPLLVALATLSAIAIVVIVGVVTPKREEGVLGGGAGAERQAGSSAWKECPREDLDELHRRLVAADLALSETGSKYWAACGTLLGAERHGGFIPWDFDIDLQMDAGDFARNKDAMRAVLREVGYDLAEDSPEDAGDMARVVRAGEGFHDTPVHLDIFTYDPREGCPANLRRHNKVYRCLEPNARDVQELELKRFGGLGLPCPRGEASARVCRRAYGPKALRQAKGKSEANKTLELDLRKTSVPALAPSPDFCRDEPERLRVHARKMAERVQP